MGETTISSTLSDAVVSDGANGGTEFSGSWTSTYDSSGDLLAVSAVNVTVTSPYGNETFQNAVIAESLGTYAIDLVNVVGPDESYAYGSLHENQFGGIYPTGTPLSFLAWTGTEPTALDSSTTLYEGPTQSSPQPLASDGFISDQDVTCFMPGTRILTPTGEIAVESLKSGDLLTLADGRTSPLRWLGRTTVATRSADPLRVLPIRIAAGALGENIPARDLLVSPDHAMFIGGNLVQAGALVNGLTITRETRVPETFTYYHVELAAHELIIAEGAPTETFVDNVDRLGFDNWQEHEALHGITAPILEMDHPRVKAARQLPAATHHLLMTRAVALRGQVLAAA